MEIYVEYVILDNFIINLLIILFCKFLTGGKYKKWGIVLSDAFGTICAVLMPLVTLKTLYMVFVKIAVGVIMVGLLKKYANFREYFLTLIVMFTVTFLMGGLCYSVNEMFGFKLSSGQLLINNYHVPVSIFCLLSSGYLYLLMWLIKYLKHRGKLNSYYFDVSVKINEKIHFFRGFLDTGNKLVCDGKGVVVIPLKVFLKEFKDFSINEICINPNYLDVKSVGGCEKIIVLNADEIHIKNCDKNITMQNAKIGLSKAGFGSDFECLLSSEILKG